MISSMYPTSICVESGPASDEVQEGICHCREEDGVPGVAADDHALQEPVTDTNITHAFFCTYTSSGLHCLTCMPLSGLQNVIPHVYNIPFQCTILFVQSFSYTVNLQQVLFQCKCFYTYNKLVQLTSIATMWFKLSSSCFCSSIFAFALSLSLLSDSKSSLYVLTYIQMNCNGFIH